MGRDTRMCTISARRGLSRARCYFAAMQACTVGSHENSLLPPNPSHWRSPARSLDCASWAAARSHGSMNIVSTEEMFALEAYEVYGSARAAQKHTGMKTRRLWPLVRQLREALSRRRRVKRSKKGSRT